jgi:hypothetical protein
MPMSHVDMVIPCYNFGGYLQRRVESVPGQRPGVDVRLLSIDDSSMDDSEVVGRRQASGGNSSPLVHPAEEAGHLITFDVHPSIG